MLGKVVNGYMWEGTSWNMCSAWTGGQEEPAPLAAFSVTSPAAPSHMGSALHCSVLCWAGYRHWGTGTNRQQNTAACRQAYSQPGAGCFRPSAACLWLSSVCRCVNTRCSSRHYSLLQLPEQTTKELWSLILWFLLSDHLGQKFSSFILHVFSQDFLKCSWKEIKYS